VRKRRQRGKSMECHVSHTKPAVIISPKTKLSVGNAEEADVTFDLGYTYSMHGSRGEGGTETKLDDTPGIFSGTNRPPSHPAHQLLTQQMMKWISWLEVRMSVCMWSNCRLLAYGLGQIR
jgi:hypothetical protein